MSKTHGRDITVDGGRFLINGEQRNLYGGAVHYWRLDRNKWDSILESVKSMGFNMISIYIPWEIHEVSKGEFDFSGNKDIDAFLTLCESKGFAIVVRPGPQINSELTWFGYPKRILENERLQARNAKGARTVLTQVPKPIPALNYAEDEFFDETALWYDAICEILARHAHPKGGIVAAQVDNEMAYFFCINAYAADFSDASLRNYRAFLSSKYGSLETINEAHGTTAATMAAVEAGSLPLRCACDGCRTAGDADSETRTGSAYPRGRSVGILTECGMYGSVLKCAQAHRITCAPGVRVPMWT